MGTLHHSATLYPLENRRKPQTVTYFSHIH